MPQPLSYIRYLPDLSYKPVSRTNKEKAIYSPTTTLAFALQHEATGKGVVSGQEKHKLVAVPVTLSFSRSERRSPLAGRPFSTEELGKFAVLSQPTETQFNASLSSAVKYMEIYLRQALDDTEYGDMQMAWVNQARVAMITTQRIIKHPEYPKDPSSDFIKMCGKRTEHCLTEMERLKPILESEYQKYLNHWFSQYPEKRLDPFGKPPVEWSRLLNLILARDEEEIRVRDEIYVMKKRMRRRIEEEGEEGSDEEEQPLKSPRGSIPPSHKVTRKPSQVTVNGTGYKPPPPPDPEEISRKLYDIKLQEATKHHREREGIAQRQREADEEANRRRGEIARQMVAETPEGKRTRETEVKETMETLRKRHLEEQKQLEEQRRQAEQRWQATHAQARRQEEENRKKAEEARRQAEEAARLKYEEEKRKWEVENAEYEREKKLTQVNHVETRRGPEPGRESEKDGIARRRQEAEQEARAARSSSSNSAVPLTAPLSQPPSTPSRAPSKPPPPSIHKAHPKPQRARSSLPDIIEPPMTTTSPMPKEKLRPIALIMSDEQRKQGYMPSLQSPYSHTFETVTTLPDTSLLFQPNHPDGASRYRIPASPDRPPAHVRHLWDIQLGIERPPRPITPGSRILGPDQVKADERRRVHKNEGLKTVKLPSDLTSRFLLLAGVNTLKNKETLGLLMGKESKGMYVVSHLVIPKQSGTSDSCVMEDEEAVAEFAMPRGLITIGWIHTHPTQSCFMSSMDMHTQASFQAQLPEFIGIVCSPNFTPPTGIFRLTDPPGLKSILLCNDKAPFHPHSEEEDSLYTDADSGSGHIMFTNESLPYIADLRNLIPD